MKTMLSYPFLDTLILEDFLSLIQKSKFIELQGLFIIDFRKPNLIKICEDVDSIGQQTFLDVFTRHYRLDNDISKTYAHELITELEHRSLTTLIDQQQLDRYVHVCGVEAVLIEDKIKSIINLKEIYGLTKLYECLDTNTIMDDVGIVYSTSNNKVKILKLGLKNGAS